MTVALIIAVVVMVVFNMAYVYWGDQIDEFIDNLFNKK